VSRNERELMREALRKVGADVERMRDAELLQRYLILTRHVVEDFKSAIRESEEK
jgi:hypothetical protein